MTDTPEAWKLVPVEPTEEMWEAGYKTKRQDGPVGVYTAMLAAAPDPTGDEGLVERMARSADTIERQQARIAELEAAHREAIEALIWCSGSADFAPEGKARTGWERGCQPLIDAAIRERGKG